jgi:hypothetical protein
VVYLPPEETADAAATEIIRRKNKRQLGSLLTAWKTDFLEPLQQTELRTVGAQVRPRLVELASFVIERLPEHQSLVDLEAEGQQLLDRSIEEAVLACNQHIVDNKTFRETFLGATKHFTVPACGNPDELRKNPASMITVLDPFEEEITPDTIKGQVTRKAKQARVRVLPNLERFFGISDAMAESFSIIVVPEGQLSLPHIQDGAPSRNRAVTQFGLVHGYAPADQQQPLSLESLELRIRALAAQLGAEQ